jgi:hypothetical protein
MGDDDAAKVWLRLRSGVWRTHRVEYDDDDDATGDHEL